ncbi:MAG: hypothetical protein RLY14_3437 [Planctomycetota bacterium]|jgi:hypothetical protein
MSREYPYGSDFDDDSLGRAEDLERLLLEAGSCIRPSDELRSAILVEARANQDVEVSYGKLVRRLLSLAVVSFVLVSSSVAIAEHVDRGIVSRSAQFSSEALEEFRNGRGGVDEYLAEAMKQWKERIALKMTNSAR